VRRTGRGRGAPEWWRTALRGVLGFVVGVALWAAFSAPYERLLARAAETVLRAGESPAVTRLEAKGGEIVVERSDFPPAAPRPGLPAADIHFDFVILVALFAATRPFRFERALLGAVILFLLHVAALVCQVESLYATRLGAWSEAHYGVFARNFWAGAFHVWQIAGRFAAPFAIWAGIANWNRVAGGGQSDIKKRGRRSSAIS
jgi:hypothetical protein